ncbi:MAG: hypothetical protein M3Y85_02055 [Bacteroidota bacterium]|nr:hypothetical protein [Bacteroidota bacterium]
MSTQKKLIVLFLVSVFASFAIHAQAPKEAIGDKALSIIHAFKWRSALLHY